MERINKYCPMKWRILSGDEEAMYGFYGALGNQLEDGRHYTTIDIGGGSTELALGNKNGSVLESFLSCGSSTPSIYV